jgi:hypothetical protein
MTALMMMMMDSVRHWIVKNIVTAATIPKRGQES